MQRSSLNDLSGVLWRERDVLRMLLGRLREQNADTGGLLRTISGLELHRAITAREAGLELGFIGEATLLELARKAPEEWVSVLEGHHRALSDLVADIQQHATVQRSLQEFLA